MADDVPISILFQKLQSVLVVLAEGRFIFPGLANRVDVALKELKHILIFLHAENNNTTGFDESRLRLWPRLLRTLYSAEYIIESFLLNTQQRRPWIQIQFTYKTNKIVRSFRDVSTQLFPHQHRPATQQDEYNILDHKKFNQTFATHEKMQHDVLVGRGDVEKELIARLTDNEEEKNLRVISLVSEEALGKTALARNVYNRVDIRQHFQCRAWLHVAKDFTYKDLLLAIIKQIPICGVLADVELMSEHQLSALLFQILMELRFLIVLDGICTNHVWLMLARPFADAANGSRVILTTRDSKVASEVDPWGHPLKLMRLSDEESWELFLKVVNGANYDNLNNFKVGIVRICRGLPLAIVLLGGLLLSIQPNDEWSGVMDHLSQYLGDDDQSVDLLTIVALCYHELPYVLKPCFLYLTLFPKAYEIPTRRLLQLWIAEGFIQISTTTATGVLEPEDLAKAYLEELVSRNMIEIATWKEDGSPKTCRMPSFLFDVFLPKAEDIGFLQIRHCNSHVHESNRIIRRLADHYVGVKATLESHTQHLCSYVSFEAQKQGTSNREVGTLLNTIISKRRSRGIVLMKVLDLEGVYKPLLPEKLGQNLQNLRYLGLRWTGLESCPETIGDLPCLETLDLKYTNITTLPGSIWKAKNLRHLFMNEVSIAKPSSKESSPTNLQTLMGLLLGAKDPYEYGLDWFTSLRKLGVSCHPKSAEKAAKCISGLDKLQTLRLRSKDRFGQPLDLELSPLTDHQSLSNLYLFGVIKDGIKYLPLNLKVLTLSMSKLTEDPMPVIGKLLPQLNVLKILAFSYLGSEMRCVSGNFPKLHVLKLWMLENLVQWTLEGGAMPQLAELEIRGCKKLTKLDGLEHLPSLKELLLTNMSPDFVADVKKRLGSNILLTNEWEPSSLA
ncbi:unnamed protein product [Camellia sinensis]